MAITPTPGTAPEPLTAIQEWASQLQPILDGLRDRESAVTVRENAAKQMEAENTGNAARVTAAEQDLAAGQAALKAQVAKHESDVATFHADLKARVAAVQALTLPSLG